MRPDVGVAVRSYPGELVCGDLACVRGGGARLFALLLDATGHGSRANEIVSRVERWFNTVSLTDPAALLTELHALLRGTDGGACGVARLDLHDGRLCYAAVGNVAARLWGSRDLRLVSRDGTIGLRFRPPKLQQVHMSPGDVLILHSDGVGTRFGADELPELYTGAAQSIAVALVERFGKSHDDASCLVVRRPK